MTTPEKFYAGLRAWFPYWVRARLYLIAVAGLGVGVVAGIITADYADAVERLGAAALLGMALANVSDPPKPAP